MSTIIQKQVNTFNWIKVNDFSKVITRRKYDTATADLQMWTYDETKDAEIKECGDSRAVFLFHKRNGEFFSYTVIFDSLHIDNFLLINKRILKPLSLEEAKDFVEKYGTGSEYEKIFGKVEE